MDFSHEDIQRFLANVKIDELSGCHLWTGGKISSGYGALILNGKQTLAHRFSYEINVGPLPAWGPPDYPQLDHICRKRDCVNPSHLRLISRKENILSGNGMTAINHSKTHCRNGHPYSPENTKYRIVENGWGKGTSRMCRICRRATELARVKNITQEEALRKIASGELSMEKISLVGRKYNLSGEERDKRREQMRKNRRVASK